MYGIWRLDKIICVFLNWVWKNLAMENFNWIVLTVLFSHIYICIWYTFLFNNLYKVRAKYPIIVSCHHSQSSGKYKKKSKHTYMSFIWNWVTLKKKTLFFRGILGSQKVQRSPIYSLPHRCTASPTGNIPHQSGTFIRVIKLYWHIIIIQLNAFLRPCYVITMWYLPCTKYFCVPGTVPCALHAV